MTSLVAAKDQQGFMLWLLSKRSISMALCQCCDRYHVSFDEDRGRNNLENSKNNNKAENNVPTWFSTNQRARGFQSPSSLRFRRRTSTTLLPEVCMYRAPLVAGLELLEEPATVFSSATKPCESPMVSRAVEQSSGRERGTWTRVLEKGMRLCGGASRNANGLVSTRQDETSNNSTSARR